MYFFFIVSLEVLVLALDFVFCVFPHVNYFFCPEEGTGCPENWTISIVRVVNHFSALYRQLIDTE